MAMLVAQHLDFDVPGIDDEFLDEDAVVAERRFGLGLGEAEAFGDLGFRMRDPHALAAAAGRSLDHHGVADLVGDLQRVFFVLDHAEMARHGRDPGFRGGLLGFDLVAHGGDGAGVGADENDAGLAERARKGFALGQETVAGMHRFRAGLAAGLDDPVDRKIAFGRRRRPDQNRLVRHLDMERVAVGLGIDRDGRDPHPAGGLDDPAGDLAAIGDQNSFEHGLLLATFGRDRARTRSAIWPAQMDVTIPSHRRQRLICRKPALSPGRDALTAGCGNSTLPQPRPGILACGLHPGRM